MPIRFNTYNNAPRPQDIEDMLKKINKKQGKSTNSTDSCSCPCCKRNETPTKPYDLDLMGVNYDDTQRMTIFVADKNDKVIQSCLDVIALRNIALLNMQNED